MQYQDPKDVTGVPEDSSTLADILPQLKPVDGDKLPAISALISTVKEARFLRSIEAAQSLANIATEDAKSGMFIVDNLALDYSVSNELNLKILNALMLAHIDSNVRVGADNPTRKVLLKGAADHGERWDAYDRLCRHLTTQADSEIVYRHGALQAFFTRSVEIVYKKSKLYSNNGKPLFTQAEHDKLSSSFKVKPKNNPQRYGAVAGVIAYNCSELAPHLISTAIKEAFHRASTRDIEETHLDGLAYALGAMSTASRSAREHAYSELITRVSKGGTKYAIFVGNALGYIEAQNIGISKEVTQALETGYREADSFETAALIAQSYAQYSVQAVSRINAFCQFTKSLLSDSTKDTRLAFFSAIVELAKEGIRTDRNYKTKDKEFWYKAIQANGVLNSWVHELCYGDRALFDPKSRKALFDGILALSDVPESEKLVEDVIKTLTPMLSHLSSSEYTVISQVLYGMSRHRLESPLDTHRSDIICKTLLETASSDNSPMTKVRALEICWNIYNFQPRLGSPEMIILPNVICTELEDMLASPLPDQSQKEIRELLKTVQDARSRMDGFPSKL